MEAVELPENLARMVFEELGQTAETIRESVALLRKSIKKTIPKPVLEGFDMSDKNLLRFLRGRKFDVKNAVTVVSNYVKFRKSHPEWFSVSPEEVEAFMTMTKVSNGLDAHLRRTVMVVPAAGLNVVTDSFLSEHPLTLTKFRIWFFEQLSWDPYVQLAGIVVIVSFQHMSFWDSARLYQMSSLYEHVECVRFATECSGFRVKALAVFEEPMFFGVVWSAASLFMSEAFKSRLRLCGNNYAILEKLIGNTDHIPACIGGKDSDDLLQNNWITQARDKAFNVPVASSVST